MEHHNQTFLIVLVAVVIAAGVLASFGLTLFAGPTPEIVLPTPAASGAADADAETNSQNILLEVTPDTVQSVIAALDRVDSYARTITTTLEDMSVVTQVWVDGDWTRTDRTLPNGISVHTIVGDDTVWRWYNETLPVVSWPSDKQSADLDGQRIPTYEDVLAVDPAQISNAGFQKKNGVNCIFVEVDVPELEQRERYWVSDEQGLLVAAETITEQGIVYQMSAGATEVPVPISASFALPDGTVLHTIGPDGTSE